MTDENRGPLGPVQSIGLMWETWNLVFHFGEVEGRFEVIGLDVRSFQQEPAMDGDKPVIRYVKHKLVEPQKLLAATLRALPLATEASKARKSLGDMVRWRASQEGTDDQMRKALHDAADLLTLPKQGHNAGHFARVAEIYSKAYREKRPPTKAVADQMHASRSAAAKWVARARVLGLLGKTQRRQAGGVAHPKQIVDAVGISDFASVQLNADEVLEPGRVLVMTPDAAPISPRRSPQPARSAPKTAKRGK